MSSVCVVVRKIAPNAPGAPDFILNFFLFSKIVVLNSAPIAPTKDIRKKSYIKTSNIFKDFIYHGETEKKRLPHSWVQ